MQGLLGLSKLIDKINEIAKNRCSLLDEDVDLLNEVIVLLKKMKRRQCKTDQLDTVIKIVDLLSKVFLVCHELPHVIAALNV